MALEDKIKNLEDKIENYIKNTGDKALSAGTDIAVGIYQGVKAVEALGTAFSGVDQKITSQTETANKLRIQFQQTFGILDTEVGRKFNQRIVEYGAELNKLGIRTQIFAQNLQRVGEQFNQIRNSTIQSNNELARAISINEKFGIGTENSIKLINYLSTGFNKGASEVTRFSEVLAGFARDTGQSFNRVFQDFTRSIDSFYVILDPEKATSQFMAFQQMARGFGTTVDALLDTAAKFDSIEQGVEFGARLNNVLSTVGSSFDSMLASTMNYDDRIQLIIQSIAGARGRIDEMSDISRMAFMRELQNASGLSGQMLQAILKNEQLVGSIEDLTGVEFGEVAAAPLEKMADNFTDFQTRQNMYMDQYLRIGAQLERFQEQQIKFTQDLQRNALATGADIIVKSKNMTEMIQQVLELPKKLIDNMPGLIKEFESQVDALKKSLGKTPYSAFLEGDTTSGIQRPSRDEQVSVIKDGTTAAVAEAIRITRTEERAAGAREITITVNSTPQLKALLDIMAKATATITGQ